MQKLSEKEFRDVVDPYLEKYFNIEREVRSSCGTARLDYVLENKRTGDLFGIEAKQNGKLRGEHMGKNLLQCKRYTSLTWIGNLARHQKVPIFLMPGISEQFIQIDKQDDGWCKKIPGEFKLFYRAYHSHYHEHHNLNSIISTAFNVGEVKLEYFNGKKEMYFSFNNKIIWSARYGVHKKNYDFLFKKIIRL